MSGFVDIVRDLSEPRCHQVIVLGPNPRYEDNVADVYLGGIQAHGVPAAAF